MCHETGSGFVSSTKFSKDLELSSIASRRAGCVVSAAGDRACHDGQLRPRSVLAIMLSDAVIISNFHNMISLTSVLSSSTTSVPVLRICLQAALVIMGRDR